ncbi:Zn(II)2Cys6 transcription factor [Aspergillus homomorphus CBS 101889]|uniref:Fungal-specific transcription factor domain protein n=1 Tax=Aspergillus homomorphus (strain CBS 101889) TaxID=1450537 RepID=A0A395IDV5_ASPHC|nr:fungal-specific transcription factor domain protein [Aspergillus homomorphus CBS 101889]RAL16344.1 fungal-specific transcription factor domain protein [Aspergillus homomorphus CBS 101889]
MNHEPRQAELDSRRTPLQPHSLKPTVRLSCETCRQRKVKCDKLNPCTNCQRLGTRCVPVERARLPRGRSGRLASERSNHDPDANLRDRVAKLEGIIRDLARSGYGSSTRAAVPDAAAAADGPSYGSRSTTGKDKRSDDDAFSEDSDGGVQTPDSYLGSSFWANLLNEVPELHSNDDRSPREGSRKSAGGQLKVYRRLLATVSHRQHDSTSGEQSGTSSYARQQLCRVFLERVDPVVKILHRPTLCAFLLEGKPYLDYELEHLAPTALASAVHYAASCSLLDDECTRAFGVSKASLVARYQREAELALGHADYLTTNDLTVLQAFVLFLVALRSQDQSRRMWTMLSMALRIAQAQSLHLPDPPFSVRPFERELRQRLWQAIGFLDILASMDRDTEPMMQAHWLQSHPPTHVNDEDIYFDMQEAPVDSPGFTDMTFTMIVGKAHIITRLINFSDFTEPSVNTLALRQQLVVDFQHTASKLLHHAQTDKVPFQWFTRLVAEGIYACMQLIVIRPLKRTPRFTPPHVRGDRLLEFAVNILKNYHCLRDDPRTVTWLWVEFAFPPWHGLAVAIAELCVCQDKAVMERFWPAVEQTFDRLGRLVADSKRGMLWKPMEKIMIQARARRAQLLAAPNDSAPYTYPASSPSSSHRISQPHIPPPTTLYHPEAAPQPQPPLPYPSSLSTDSRQQPHQQDQSVHIDAVAALGTPESLEGAASWPSVWDAIDLGYADSANETAWMNYENFLTDIYILPSLR